MNDHLGHKTRRGLSWNLAGAVVVNAMRLVVLVVLGRVLTSTDFGIVAAAISVNTVVHSVRDFGIGPALIQRKQLEEGHLTTAFAVITYLGLALSSLLIALAGPIGRAFGIPESISIIRALAFLFVLRNVAATSRMRLRRDMNFRLLAFVDAFSFCVGSAVSILSAVLGGGAWALVEGYLVEEIISTAMQLYYAPPKVSFRIDRARLRDLLGYGVGQTITQIANTGAMYGDNLVVGDVLGARELGFYSRAYDLIRFPAIVFDAIVANVLFPAFSRIQDDADNLAVSLRRGTFVNALLLAPAGAALIALAPEAIRILVGPHWAEAILPFQILAITMVLRTNQKLAVLVAQAAGIVNAVAAAVIVYMICVVAGAAVMVRWGIPGVAASTTFAIFVVSVESCYLAMRVSGLRLAALLGAYVPGLVLSVLVLAVAWPLAAVLRGHALPAPVIFVIVTLASIALCGAVVAIWVRRGRGDFAWLGDELRTIRRKLGLR